MASTVIVIDDDDRSSSGDQPIFLDSGDESDTTQLTKSNDVVVVSDGESDSASDSDVIYIPSPKRQKRSASNCHANGNAAYVPEEIQPLLNSQDSQDAVWTDDSSDDSSEPEFEFDLTKITGDECNSESDDDTTNNNPFINMKY